MNKYFIIFVTILSLMVPQLAWAKSFDDYTLQQVSQCDQYKMSNVSANSTSSTVTLTNDTKAIYLENTGTKTAYVNLVNVPATVSTDNEMILESGKNRSLEGFKTRTIAVVTNGSDTTTVKVESCR